MLVHSLATQVTDRRVVTPLSKYLNPQRGFCTVHRPVVKPFESLNNQNLKDHTSTDNLVNQVCEYQSLVEVLLIGFQHYIRKC